MDGVEKVRGIKGSNPVRATTRAVPPGSSSRTASPTEAALLTLGRERKSMLSCCALLTGYS